MKEIKDKPKASQKNCKCSQETMKKIEAIMKNQKWKKVTVVEVAVAELYDKIFK